MTCRQTIETWNRKKVQITLSTSTFLGKDMITISMTLETHTMLTKNIHTPPTESDWTFLEGGGFWQTKKFK